MADVITMLALSPTMDEGTLAEWTKSEGDTIAEGEVLAEVETDKATMEMESFFEGTILKLLVKPGDAVPVGAPIAVVGEEGEDISEVLAEFDTGEIAADQVSEEGEGGATGAPAPPSGTGDGGIEAEPTELAPAAEAQTSVGASAEARGRIKASPLAKRIAEEQSVDLAALEGSGPGGRIIKRDIERAVEQGVAGQRQARRAATVQPVAEAAQVTEVPLSQMRKTIARRLQEAWAAPHFMLTMDIDMARTMALRKEVNAQFKDAGIEAKLSVNDFIVKACAVALKHYPKMNVAFQGDHIAQHDAAHVSVAVATDEGLITPVVRHADQKTLRQISAEVRDMATRAQDKRLKPEEYTGGTFSVSNLGMYGIDHFTAVLNPPQAGILACGAVKKEPVVEGDALVVGTRMKVTLSCDHRAVDGATGAEYLQELKRLLENPMLMMV